MEQSKAQAIHKKIDGLGEGMARRLMEVYNELANNRFVLRLMRKMYWKVFKIISW